MSRCLKSLRDWELPSNSLERNAYLRVVFSGDDASKALDCITQALARFGSTGEEASEAHDGITQVVAYLLPGITCIIGQN